MRKWTQSPLLSRSVSVALRRVGIGPSPFSELGEGFYRSLEFGAPTPNSDEMSEKRGQGEEGSGVFVIPRLLASGYRLHLPRRQQVPLAENHLRGDNEGMTGAKGLRDLNLCLRLA